MSNNPTLSLGKDLYDSLVLAVLPFTGTLRDWSSTGAAVTNVGGQFVKRNGTYNAVVRLNESINVAHDTAQQSTDFTLFAAGDFIEAIHGARIIIKADVTKTFDWYMSAAPALGIADGSGNFRLASVEIVGARSFATVVSSGGTPLAYRDGIYAADFNDTVSITPQTQDIHIGSKTSSGNDPSWPNSISTAMLFNRVLTPQEIAQVHAWSQNRFSPVYTNRQFYFPSTINPREDGLVGAWDFSELRENSLVDVSGNGNDGTVNGNVQKVTTPAGEAGKFDGVSSYVEATASNLPTDYPCTILCSVKINSSAGVSFFSGVYDNASVSRYVSLFHNAGKIVGRVNNISAQDAQSTHAGFNDGIFHRVALVATTGNDITLYVDGEVEGTSTGGLAFPSGLNVLSVGRASDSTPSGYLDGDVTCSTLYSRALTQQEIEQDYQAFAQRPIFVDDLAGATESLATVSSGNLENTEWKVESGSWKISWDDDLEQKVIECDTAGNLYTESELAYGTWEFSLRKGAGTNQPVLMIMASNKSDTYLAPSDNTGYGMYMNTSGFARVLFVKNTGGAGTNLFYTDTGYVDDFGTWYTFRITRRYDGQFYLYIKGGSFTSWTLIDVSGGSGTNPVTDNTYTTSQYCVLDADAGDKIANFKFYQGVMKPA